MLLRKHRIFKYPAKFLFVIFALFKHTSSKSQVANFCLSEKLNKGVNLFTEKNKFETFSWIMQKYEIINKSQMGFLVSKRSVDFDSSILSVKKFPEERDGDQFGWLRLSLTWRSYLVNWNKTKLLCENWPIMVTVFKSINTWFNLILIFRVSVWLSELLTPHPYRSQINARIINQFSFCSNRKHFPCFYWVI